MGPTRSHGHTTTSVDALRTSAVTGEMLPVPAGSTTVATFMRSLT